MKGVLHTLLILLGLWTNVLGSAVTACQLEGACSPTPISECGPCHLDDHDSDHHAEGEIPHDSDLDSDLDSEDSGSDDHHHCKHGQIIALALPPLPANRLAPTLPAVDATLANLPAPPEAPVFSVEQPPRA